MRMINLKWVFLVLLTGVLLSGASAEKTLVSDVEDISARNATTRIFNRTYSVPVLDAQFQPTGETRLETRKLVEKADGLCYDAALDESQELVGPERWEPTVAQFVNDSQGGWRIGTGPAKVHIAPDANSSSLISFTIPFRISNPDTSDRLNPSLKRLLTITMKGGALYYVCGEQNALLEVPRAVAGHADGNRIIFKGAFSCGDLEFVYEKGAFHQNVVIRNAAALPAPSALGLSPGNTQLRIVTDIDDVSPENASVASQMKEEHYGDVSTAALKFKDASGKALCAFVRSEAWAESKPSERIMMEKSITVSPRSNKQYKHAEGVPYSYIMEKSAADAVVMDYQMRYGEAEISEAWQAGVTYLISDLYTIGEGITLVIEGGAVIKTSCAIALYVDGGNILVKGTPFNYVLFTKESDNTVGETISYPGSNPHINFIRYLPHDNTTAEIQFAKFANTEWVAFYIDAPSGITTFNKIIVRDSIFRDIDNGIDSVFHSAAYMDIFNCLFSDFSNIAFRVATDNAIQTLCIWNCTFDTQYDVGGGSTPIILGGSSFYALIQNNIYSTPNNSIRYAIDGNPTFTNNSYINNDATNGLLYSRLTNTVHQALPQGNDEPTTGLVSRPYKTSPNGNYYLGEPNNQSGIPQGTLDNLSDDYKNHLAQTTVIRPSDMNSTNERSYLTRIVNWSDRWSDTGTPYVGLHYDIVHGVVDAQGYFVNITSNLDLQPGVVIAINNSKGIWVEGSGVTLKSNGLPNKRIRFIGLNATCDKLRDPYKVSSSVGPYGLVVISEASMECDFTEFSFLCRGFYIDIPNNIAVKNSIFKNNDEGVYLRAKGKNCSVQNCQFINNNNGIHFGMANTDIGTVKTSNCNVIGNTFDKNGTGIFYDYQVGYPTVCNTVVEDNVLSDNIIAINRNTSNNLTIHDITRHNIFWNNEMNNVHNALNLSDVTNMCLANGNEVNPLFAHRSRSADGSIIKNWESDKEVPIDGYYLAQREGDASRRPFILREDQQLMDIESDGLTMEGIRCIQGDAWVLAGNPAGSLCENNFRGMGTFNENQFSYTNKGSQSVAGPLCIIFHFAFCPGQGQDCGASENGVVQLKFEDGSIFKALIMFSGIAEGSYYAAWVSEDGSTYAAKIGGNPNEYWNMDAWYAIRWQSNNLLRSAYDGLLITYNYDPFLADSPAVDAGSKDWLNGGFTNTDYSSADNPAPLNFGDPDNLDGNGEPVAWNDSDKHLDIGYHYGAAEQTKDSVTTYTTLRHPKERISSFDGISPNVSSSGDMVLVSGKYDATIGKDTTIAIYKGTTTNNQIPICYKIFRGSDTEMGLIEEIQVESRYPNLQNLMITGTSGPQGAIYVAIIDWVIKTCPAEDYVNDWHINIFRYVDNSQNPYWQKIGTIYPDSSDVFSGSPTSRRNLVGLAAQDNNLWVFFLVECPDGIKLYGSFLPNAANMEEEERMDFLNLTKFDFSRLSNDKLSLKSDWDEYIKDYNNNGSPRIIYTYQFYIEPGDEPIYYPAIRSIRIRLNQDGSIRDIWQDFNVINEMEGYINPSFCVNRPDARFDVNVDDNRAFCRFVNQDGNLIKKRNLLVNTQNNQDIDQEWFEPQNPSIEEASQPSVTYRIFGVERLFYKKNYNIYMDEEGIFEQATGSVDFPTVTTERPKSENIFLMHKGETSDIIDLYQINP